MSMADNTPRLQNVEKLLGVCADRWAHVRSSCWLSVLPDKVEDRGETSRMVSV